MSDGTFEQFFQRHRPLPDGSCVTEIWRLTSNQPLPVVALIASQGDSQDGGIEVTDEMIDAGTTALFDFAPDAHFGVGGDAELVRKIFVAMARKSPSLG